MRFLNRAIIAVLLPILWVGLEFILDGQVVNQRSDTVFAVILIFLIEDKLHNIFKNKRSC